MDKYIEVIGLFVDTKSKTTEPIVIACNILIKRKSIDLIRPTFDESGVITRDHANIVLKNGREVLVKRSYEDLKNDLNIINKIKE